MRRRILPNELLKPSFRQIIEVLKDMFFGLKPSSFCCDEARVVVEEKSFSSEELLVSTPPVILPNRPFFGIHMVHTLVNIPAELVLHPSDGDDDGYLSIEDFVVEHFVALLSPVGKLSLYDENQQIHAFSVLLQLIEEVFDMCLHFTGGERSACHAAVMIDARDFEDVENLSIDALCVPEIRQWSTRSRASIRGGYFVEHID
jgi:hypothetical protein